MTLWPDFGGDGAYGIPFVSVPFTQPLVPISFDEADESDPGPVPDAARRAGRGRRRPPRARPCARATASCSSCTRPRAQGGGWHAYSGAVVGPALKRAAPGALDLRRRRRAADPARARAPRRGGRRRHPARAAHHRADHPAGLHPPGHALGVVEHRSRPAADGSAAAPEGELRHQRACTGQARVVAQALKTYGALVADNAGSPRVYMSAARSTWAGTTTTSTG